jgi:HK97 family phage prohead protease
MTDPRGMRGMIVSYNTALAPNVNDKPSKHRWVFLPGAFAASLRAIDRGERVVSLLAGHDWKQHVTTTRRGLHIFSTSTELRFEMLGLDQMSRKAIAAAHRLRLSRVSVGATTTTLRPGELRGGGRVMLVQEAELNEISLVADGADRSSYVEFSFPKLITRSRPLPMPKTSRCVTAAEMVLVAMHRTGQVPSAPAEIYSELQRKGLVHRDGGRLKLTAEGRDHAKRKSRILPANGHTADTIGSGFSVRGPGSVCDLIG